MTRSKVWNISEEGICIVAMIVIPSLAYCRRRMAIYLAVMESRPEVGSSKNSTLGFVIISYPIEVRFLSPPEIPFIRVPPTRVSAQAQRRSLSSISATLSLHYSYVIFEQLILRAKVKHSRGVIVSINTSSYYTKAPNMPNSDMMHALPFTSISPE